MRLYSSFPSTISSLSALPTRGSGSSWCALPCIGGNLTSEGERESSLQLDEVDDLLVSGLAQSQPVHPQQLVSGLRGIEVGR